MLVDCYWVTCDSGHFLFHFKLKLGVLVVMEGRHISHLKMDVHTHFQALGLKRGASEGDMRKAYHRKALEYHPDRNPEGADVFKRIHCAYEALQKHYKSHGGIDFASTARPSHVSEPLFSEEELFRDSKVGSSRASDGPRCYPYRRFRQSTVPSGPPMFAEDNAQAAQQHAHAHKGRTPVSGYNPFNGDPEEMDGFVSQAKHFADMEQRKARLSRASGASPETLSMPTSESPRRGKKKVDEPAPSHQKLSDEWKAQRENAIEIEKARAQLEESERKSRKAQLERETREEWDRMTAEMETQAAAKAASTAQREAIERNNKQTETNNQLRALQAERRDLKRELFRRRMPSAGEVGQMSVQELVLMREVLDESLENISRKLRDALRPTSLCVTCGVSAKDLNTKRFACSHLDFCVDCGRNCIMCPVCGADNLDLMRDE